MRNVLNVVLSHQSPADVDRLAAYWESMIGDSAVLIAYGGPRESFDKTTAAMLKTDPAEWGESTR